MNNKQKRTLEKIKEIPTRSDINYADVKKLIEALGGKVVDGSGSRVKFRLNEEFGDFHKPHPQKELKKYAVEYLRKFLENAGF